jgi:hypothetical protein
MKKYDSYDSAEAFTGEYEKLVPGGYICVILKVAVEEKNYGHLMRIAFDIASGPHEGFYERQFKRRKENNKEAKWPGMYYQTIKEDGLQYFKGFMQTIEQSNPGFKWDWDEKKLVGKLFGGVFGEEEYLGNDGNIKTSVKCFYVRTVEQIQTGVEIPEPKKLKTSAGYIGQEVQFTEDDIPF